MTENIILSLQITAVGMGLVFGAIIVLWGLMSLLTAIIKDRQPAAEAESAPAPAPAMDSGLKARAAAVAVTLAIAEQQTSTAHPLPPPPTSLVSAWQLGLRSRQLVEKGSHR
jgi:Na+-transporting methylmalonyl-CoA/oxaloacetate decarboxylase gamma subunit